MPHLRADPHSAAPTGWRRFADGSLLSRAAILGALIFGCVGSVAGLVIGLRTYAPTAWFAVIEVAVPSVLLGAAVGLIVGAAILTARKFRQTSRL